MAITAGRISFSPNVWDVFLTEQYSTLYKATRVRSLKMHLWSGRLTSWLSLFFNTFGQQYLALLLGNNTLILMLTSIRTSDCGAFSAEKKKSHYFLWRDTDFACSAGAEAAGFFHSDGAEKKVDVELICSTLHGVSPKLVPFLSMPFHVFANAMLKLSPVTHLLHIL